MTDLEIIKRIRAGNINAYAELIERYENKIYAAISRCVADEEKAVKMVEEIFVQAYLHVGNVDGEADFIMALFRVAVSHLRPACVTDETKQILAVYEKIQGLESLPRQIVLLRSLYGLTYEQISEKLNIDADQVVSVIADARQKIVGQSGCDKYWNKMQAYLDNELMRMERMEVEVHLEQCDRCAEIYEQMTMMFPVDIYMEMSSSVAQTALVRIQEEVVDDSDAFTSESKRERMSQKLEKNKNLYTWIIVLCVLLFGAFSWLFSLISGGQLAAQSSNLQSGAHSQIADAGEFSQALAGTIQKADAVFVQFGVSRVGVTEEPIILMFADYIAAQPSVEYRGTAVTGSLGTISFEPVPSYSITITSSHHLLVDDGQTIWEIQTTRDELLEILHALGV